MALLPFFTSCEKDLPTYATSDCNLNFVYRDYENKIKTSANVTDEDRTYSFSFVYSGMNVQQDTVWFEVSTMGHLSDVDRTFALEQIQIEGVENAVAGTHYQAFDTPSLQKFYVIKAGKNSAMIPVVLLRDARVCKSI